MRSDMTKNEKMPLSLPEGEKVVSMVIFKDQLYIATNRRVFRMVEDKLAPMVIAFKDS